MLIFENFSITIEVPDSMDMETLTALSDNLEIMDLQDMIEDQLERTGFPVDEIEIEVTRA
jgi:hypothetical protein